jgi:hypothetical protein
MLNTMQSTSGLSTEVRYRVIDAHTKQVIKDNLSKQSARRLAERKDLEYGAYRYYVEPMD